MANNFKLSGNIYVSKAGHDSNDGTTPDTPKKSWAGVDGITVVGAGEYNVGSMYSFPSFETIGDGKVIFNAINNSTCTLGEIGYRLTGIALNNYNGISVNSTLSPCVIDKCILKNWTRLSYMSSNFGRSIYVVNSKLLNCECLLENLYCDNFYVDGCIFINSPLYSNYQSATGTGKLRISNSYFDFDTYINLSFSDPGYFRNNNINGTIYIGSTLYAIKDQLIGTPQDNGYALGVQWLTEANLTANGYTGIIAGWDIAVATCINRDPLFNNISFEDFSLQAGSPHIGRSTSNLNIGSTKVAVSFFNNSTSGQVIPSAEIDTTNPNSYVVKSGFSEGYIDYIQKIGSINLTLKEIEPITSLEFNSDVQGGQIGNRNVPDSEPLTIEYPRKLTTTSLAPDDLTLNVTAHDAVVGEWVRVAGQDRQVTAITTDTITVGTAFRAAVASGVIFQIGPKVRIGALNPNRITFMMRTSKSDNPQLDSDWDNDVDPTYNKAGDFLTQEWGVIPGYYIDTAANEVWGSGDSETPIGLTKNEISCKWIHIRVYIRNNYES